MHCGAMLLDPRYRKSGQVLYLVQGGAMLLDPTEYVLVRMISQIYTWCMVVPSRIKNQEFISQKIPYIYNN
jgi:hypothetical protein